MYILNLFGGPCAGKTTFSSGIFSLLKLNGLNVELVTEFAKDLTWEKREVALNNQSYIFGKQYHKLWRLQDKVDVIITDSPLILGLLYAGEKENDHFKNHVMETYKSFNNLNYFIHRIDKHYTEVGRNQTLEEAQSIDKANIQLLLDNNLTYTEVVGNFWGINCIVEEVLELFSQKPKHFIGRYIEDGTRDSRPEQQGN